METRRVIHPSADVLKAFGLGKLDDTSAGVVMDHLDLCADCRKEVASLSGDDFLDRLRQAHGRSSTPAPSKTLSESAAGPKAPQPRPSSSQTAIPNLPAELANSTQYEVLRELGRGGMGVVYLAKNKLMDRLEVLKVVNKALLDRPESVERFLREIRSAAKLSHANVVAAYHALHVGELLAFAMEYVEGQDLAVLVKSQGPLPVAHACYYVQQAALGLQHAFEKKMVHRDIKPQNLILAREGKKHVVKVLDFGLAKATREKTDDTGLTGEGKMLGTPDYIAPEQTLDAAKADIRADIYSLGCTLYYLLAGRPPFSASSLGAILLAHNTQEAKPLNLVRPEVPEELAAVVRKMMAKEPAKRYQTPLEVVQALSPFVKPGAAAKSSPELSSGAAEPKPAVKKVVRIDRPPEPAAKEARKQPEPEAPWGSLTEDSIAPDRPRKRGAVRPRRAATVRERTTQKKWLLGGGIGVGVLLLALLGMWACGVFKVKTKDGTLVLENLPADAEVTVDGEAVTLKWGDGKTAELRVDPGKKHRIQVRKNGFKVFGDEVEVDVGGRKPVLVRLESIDPSGPPYAAWLKEVAALPAHKQADAVAAKLKELNPAFDGKIEYNVEAGQVVSLEFVIDNVKDISPVRALPGLRKLSCIGSWFRKGQLADLTPLKGMKLTELTCLHTQVADLSPLQGMPLTNLNCGYSKVTDLSPLKGMKLTYLSCKDTQVSDLSPLKGMPLTNLLCCFAQVRDLSPLKDMKLTILLCGGAPLPDAGLMPLQEMSSLRHLEVMATNITDAELVHLKRLTDLEFLSCAGTKLTGAGLVYIEGMTRLRILHLDDTEVTDEGLVHFKGLHGLRELFLNQTPVTDAGLEHLAGLKNLALLNLTGTAVTNKGVAKLKAALPKCNIIADVKAEKPKGSAPMAEGFVPLFNGKDLTGWSVDGWSVEQWSVEGDSIVGRSFEPRTRSYLLTDKDYANFTLRFDFKVEDGNHGVAIRAIKGEKMPFLADDLIFDHPLIKLMNPAIPALNAEEPTGTTHWLKSADMHVKPSEVLSLPRDTWHTMEVVVRGDNCTARIADKQFVNVTLDRRARSKEGFVPGLQRVKGKVGFGTNTGTVRFRKIEIKELPATASEAAPAPKAAAEEKGLVPLFNGKDLTGWHLSDDGNRADWGVDGGVLHTSGRGRSWLLTDKEYGDFELRLDFKLSEKGNSGVALRSARKGNPAAVGMEIQLLDDSWYKKNSKDLKLTQLTGAIYNVIPPSRDALKATGEWNSLRIIANRSRVTVELNGVRITDADLDEHRDKAAKHPGLLNEYGHIGLQSHDGRVEFRKIEIKELPAPR